MTKVLVLYYSSYGHIETMAEAVAAGAREAGAQVDIKRGPETVPEAVAKAAHFKLDQYVWRPCTQGVVVGSCFLRAPSLLTLSRDPVRGGVLSV